MFAGCASSDKPAKTGFASVIIPDGGEAQIQQATTVVFQENGFEPQGPLGKEMTFEKRGSLANDLAYGGWIEDRTTRIRVKTELVPLPDGSHRLQCQVFMVQHAGDAFFQEEHKLPRYRAGPYQKLLEETARRVK